MRKYLHWIGSLGLMLCVAFIIYWEYIYIGLSDRCRNFETLIENSGYLPVVKQKLKIYLEDSAIQDRMNSSSAMVAKSVRLLETISPSSPKLELDWKKLDIPKGHAILKIYKEEKLVNGEKIFSISEFGIGAGRNILMFRTNEGAQDPVYVECGVYD